MNRKFFLRDPRIVARDLLGVELTRRMGSKTIHGMIVETEAYCGTQDKASHVYKGRTPRNEPMFGPPGTIYVYLVYGMHYCLNLVTGEPDVPGAVLIRGIRLMPNGHRIDGPGRLTRALSVTKSFNNKNILTDKKLRLGRRIMTPKKIIRAPRVGVDYAEEWASKPLRFLLE